MAINAIVSDGIVVNVVVLGDDPFDPGQGQSLVTIDGIEPRPGIGWAYAGGSFTAPAALPPPPEPVLTRLNKADLWRRLTDEEAEDVNAVLLASPIRLRRLYEAATYIDTADEDYPVLRASIVDVLGEDRADVVLAPNF